MLATRRFSLLALSFSAYVGMITLSRFGSFAALEHGVESSSASSVSRSMSASARALQLVAALGQVLLHLDVLPLHDRADLLVDLLRGVLRVTCVRWP